MSIKKVALAAILAVSSIGLAQASGIGGAIVVGGVGQAWAGDISGTAKSVSNGTAIAASQIAGNGTSFQHTDGFAGGNASIGGTITPVGATVATNTNQWAQVNSYGNISGPGAIAEQTVGKNTTIVNGTMGFGSSENKASGKANFQVGQIGGIVGIGGVAAIGSF